MKQFTILGDYELNQCVGLDNIINADPYYISIHFNTGQYITLSIKDIYIYIYPLYNHEKLVVGIPEPVSLTNNKSVTIETVSSTDYKIHYANVLKDLELSYEDRYLIGVKTPINTSGGSTTPENYLKIKTQSNQASQLSKSVFIVKSSTSDRPIVYSGYFTYTPNNENKYPIIIEAPISTEDFGYRYYYTGPDIIDVSTGYTGLTGYATYSDEVETTGEYTAVGYLFGTKDNFYTYTNEVGNGKLNFTITDSTPNSAYLYLATYTPKLLLSNLGVFADMEPFMNSPEDGGFKILFKRVDSSGTNYGSSTDDLSILYHT